MIKIYDFLDAANKAAEWVKDTVRLFIKFYWLIILFFLYRKII